MLTGRFVQKLNNNVLDYYETVGVEDLLSPANMTCLMSRYKDGEGEYTDTFKDDLAIAYTKVTSSADDSGRRTFDTDSIILKFTPKDFANMLDPVIRHYNLYGRMMKYLQANGETLRKPLPVVKI